MMAELGTTDCEILFTPPPDGVYTVQVWHHIGPPPLATDADATTGNFDEWIILDAAIKCRVKEESDVTALQAERAAYEARIDRWATQFDRYRTEHILDVRAEEIW
jgi:hypothetical protein